MKMSRTVARSVLTVGFFALVASQLGCGAPTPATIITHPIPVTAEPGDPSHNYPFFSTKDLLSKYDYVEEEFYIQGLAQEYTVGGQHTATVVAGGPYPYKTRVIVRRPRSAEKFNGTAILEWSNVSGMHDFEIDWDWSYEHLMQRGFAYAAVSAQKDGIDSPTGLKKWNAGRYGSLDVTAGGKFSKDELSFAIFSDVARALKNPPGVSLLGSLKVKNIIATGQSQSAGRLTTYYNSIQPLDGVVDGFVLHGGVMTGPVRTDLKIPAWKLLSETDVVRGQAPVRQPDTEFFRTWEVAGTSHGDWDLNQILNKLRARDLPGPHLGPCERPILSRIHQHLVLDAVYDWMKKWVERGVEPPHAPRITMKSIGTIANRLSEAARDENGNALGGIRLAQFAVPTATDTGLNDGPGFCIVVGSHEPFDAAKLARLYPSREKYLAEIQRATDENLKAGYITPEGAEQTRREAANRKSPW